MKILNITISVIEILLGAFFLVNMASDIQAGFGLVLLALGVHRLIDHV